MKSSYKTSFIVFILAIAAIACFVFVQSKQGKETAMPKIDKEVLLSTDNSDSNIEKAYLYDSTGGESYAMARRAYVPGEFTFDVNATIPDAADGQVYSALLLNNADEKVDAGIMQKTEEGYYLEYRSDKDLRNYYKIEITSEDSNNSVREILGGQFDGTGL